MVDKMPLIKRRRKKKPVAATFTSQLSFLPFFLLALRRGKGGGETQVVLDLHRSHATLTRVSKKKKKKKKQAVMVEDE